MYFDNDDNEIKVGSRVKSSNELPGGTVTRIEDLDCDYDDELQRPVVYGPYVFVRWDDLDWDEERFSGYSVNGYSPYQEERYVFDDFDVVEADWEPNDEAFSEALDDDTIEEGFSYGEDLT